VLLLLSRLAVISTGPMGFKGGGLGSSVSTAIGIEPGIGDVAWKT